jgi:hypothetical protein
MCCGSFLVSFMNQDVDSDLLPCEELNSEAVGVAVTHSDSSLEN